MASVRLEGVTKIYPGQVRALVEVDLLVPEGSFLTILGPSGCGKTTLLRVIAGLEQVSSGKIHIDSRLVDELPPARRDVAMVFQNYALYPHFRVYKNIAFGLKMRGLPREEIHRRVLWVAELLGLSRLLERFPRELSGGEQQRVALARALVKEPKVFLLDEPLSNLDVQIREQTRAEMKRIFDSLSATVIYVTHDQLEALSLSDLIVVMKDGQIRQIGSPEAIYHDPQELFVADFVGTHRINLIPGYLAEGLFRSPPADLSFALPLEWRGEVILGLRPEALKIGRGEILFTAQVGRLEMMGAETLIHSRRGALELRSLFFGRPELKAGDQITLGFSPRELLVFEASSGKRLH